MRRMLLAFLLSALPVSGAPAGGGPAGVGPFEANDTGGIIAWSPESQRHARVIAREHCARYGKRAQITSVYARQGQYIAFTCRFPRAYVVRSHRRPVLRVRY